jgi:hypothetical protein
MTLFMKSLGLVPLGGLAVVQGNLTGDSLSILLAATGILLAATGILLAAISAVLLAMKVVRRNRKSKARLKAA